ncbi:MAG: putative membrane protein [Sphingobacteriales bacterium]|jgi:uncharacterized membrane protein
MKDIMLITHFIGLAMAVGTGFSNLFLGIAGKDLEGKEKGEFFKRTSFLVMMGYTGITLLLVSGLYLITPYWSTLTDMPMLMAKLCFVLVLIILISIIGGLRSKAIKQNNPMLFSKIKPFGMMALLTGLIIITLAVFTFH